MSKHCTSSGVNNIIYHLLSLLFYTGERGMSRGTIKKEEEHNE
jgi:hypothetical protein